MFKEELEKIKKEAQQRLESSESLDMVNEIRVGVLGKKGRSIGGTIGSTIGRNLFGTLSKK